MRGKNGVDEGGLAQTRLAYVNDGDRLAAIKSFGTREAR